jgi:hypothetical protein
VTDEELEARFASVERCVKENRAACDARVDEVAERQATYESVTHRRLIRRARVQTAGIMLAVLLGAFVLLRVWQGQAASQRQRDAVSCADRSEAREGVRLGYLALLDAKNPTGAPLIAENSSLRAIITNDVLSKLPPITCPKKESRP